MVAYRVTVSRAALRFASIDGLRAKVLKAMDEVQHSSQSQDMRL